MPVGVVVAGGASRRLGRDKRLLRDAAGTTLLARAARRLDAAGAAPVWLLCEPGFAPPFDLPDVQVHADPEPGAGPLAALVGAAAVLRGATALVLAADVPNVPAALLGQLAAALVAAPDALVAVPAHGGRRQLLCAAYAPGVWPALAAARAAGEDSLRRALEALPAGAVLDLSPAALSVAEDAWDTVFRNLNTPAEVDAWQRQPPTT